MTLVTLRGYVCSLANGTIAGSKAHGSFKVTSRFTKNGAPSKDGSVHCTTGKVKWSAKLKS